MDESRIEHFFATLRAANPEPRSELEYSSVFELLADARKQVATVTAAIEALRDHWVAETDLQTALTGRSPNAAPAMGPTRAAAVGQGGH